MIATRALFIGIFCFAFNFSIPAVEAQKSSTSSAGGIAISVPGNPRSPAGLAQEEDSLNAAAKSKDKKSPEANKKNKLPSSGVLSRSTSTGYQSKNFDLAWGQKSGQETAPISGSVSKVSSTQWTAKLFNNSQDTYSASVSVTQFNADGKKMKSDSFSVRLKPSESYTRPIRTTELCADAQLELVSWKNLTEKKRSQQQASEQQANGSGTADSSGAPVVKK